jgi:hypothetical protein
MYPETSNLSVATEHVNSVNAPSIVGENEYSRELNQHVATGDSCGIPRTCKECPNSPEQQDRRLLELIICPGIWGARAAEIMHLDPRLVSKKLKRFENDGLIKRVSNGMPVFYDKGPRFSSSVLTRSRGTRGQLSANLHTRFLALISIEIALLW